MSKIDAELKLNRRHSRTSRRTQGRLRPGFRLLHFNKKSCHEIPLLPISPVALLIPRARQEKATSGAGTPKVTARTVHAGHRHASYRLAGDPTAISHSPSDSTSGLDGLMPTCAHVRSKSIPEEGLPLKTSGHSLAKNDLVSDQARQTLFSRRTSVGL